jgi:hypothetical protein
MGKGTNAFQFIGTNIDEVRSTGSRVRLKPGSRPAICKRGPYRKRPPHSAQLNHLHLPTQIDFGYCVSKRARARKESEASSG